jgi:hypothetical protein
VATLGAAPDDGAAPGDLFAGRVCAVESAEQALRDGLSANRPKDETFAAFFTVAGNSAALGLSRSGYFVANVPTPPRRANSNCSRVQGGSGR